MQFAVRYALPPLQLSADCVLNLTLAKDSQLTLSTLAVPAAKAPPSAEETPFPLPWRADFSGPSGKPSAMASYFQDLNGAFALARPFDGGSEPVMEQVISGPLDFTLSTGTGTGYRLCFF